MGLKSFMGKVGRGIVKAGRWLREKAFPVVGRIAKPVLSTISVLPGKIGMIGKIGSAITGMLHDTISKIPNKEVRDKLDNAVSNGNDKFQGVVDRGRNFAEGVNRTIGVGRDMYDTAKRGWNSKVEPSIRPIIRPAVLPSNPQITKFMLPNAQ